MAHEVESMAFAHAVPWHGLGNHVDPNSSVEEMQAAAGLDWLVHKRPLFSCKDVDEKTGEPKGKLTRVKGRYALTRSSDQRVLTIAGEGWKPVQNSDILGLFKAFVDAGKITLETAGSLRGGKLIWGLANLNHVYKASSNDACKGYLLIVSPHEVGMRTRVYTTSIRVVCANTMKLATDEGLVIYHQNHMSEFDVEKAKEAIEASHESLKLAEKQAKALVKTKMSADDTAQFLATFFQPLSKEASKVSDALDHSAKMLNPENWNKQMTEVMNAVNTAPGAVPGTAWGTLQGVLYWADHVAGRSADARMMRSWIGENGRLKQKVNKELLKLTA
jgi:phage/plasmid-like protein (TIGR03299 family)